MDKAQNKPRIKKGQGIQMFQEHSLLTNQWAQQQGISILETAQLIQATKIRVS